MRHFMLYRKEAETIQDWLSHGKEALLITGARQIGKTYLIRESLEQSGQSYVEFNFIEQPELIDLFAGAKNAKDLLMRISVVSSRPLVENKTILFFDEVQEFKDIVTRIKFLVEDGTFRYILSGSLLGVELHNLRSAPVGYLRILHMFPMDFMEFIRSIGVSDKTMEMLQRNYQERSKVDTYVHDKMMDLFYLYLIIGGMPEAVNVYIETNNIQRVNLVHDKIIELYKQDFTKYETKSTLRLKEIYHAMAAELNQQNKRFKLNAVKKGISYDRLENDFLWLKDAGVALPVYNVQEPKLPLQISSNRNLFKLFFSDIGLLTSRYSDIVKMKILNKDKDINNGALFENAVAQEMIARGFDTFYYNNKKLGELDFVIELDGKVCPIEVKSGKSYKRHSALENVLQIAAYGIENAFVLCNGNVEVKQKKVYLPIYMIMFIENQKFKESIYKVDINGL